MTLRKPAGTTSVVGLLTVLTALVGTISVLDVVIGGWAQPRVALAFGAVIAAGEITRLSLPGGRQSAPMAGAAALGYTLTVSISGVPTTYGAAQVVAVTAIATLLGTAALAYIGRPPNSGYLARRVLVTAVVAAIFRGWLRSGHGHAFTGHDSRRLVLILFVTAIGALLLDQMLGAAISVLSPVRVQPPLAPGRAGRPAAPALRADVSRHRWFAALAEECRASVRVCPTEALFAVAAGLTTEPLGLWALPVSFAPILIVQRSLRQYAAVRATYLQTIRALSRVTELAGYTEPGHARRVCHLALAIGRELSLSGPELLDLEYAALLHDIGQLSLTDPIPGGATVLIAADRAAKVASLGADVVRETGVLDHVAGILEHQFEPFRAELADVPVRLAGAIIRAANAYDDLAGGALDLARHVDAVWQIRRAAAVDYDPRVVESLARIVEATGPCAA